MRPGFKIAFAAALAWFIFLGWLGGAVLYVAATGTANHWIAYAVGALFLGYIAIELGWGGGKECNKSGV